MNNLITEGTLSLDSREVAEMVSKQHKELLRDIRTYSGYLAESNLALGDFFAETYYLDGNRQERPCYNVTKKGCEFIAHKLTGAKGAVFTATYINKFHEMEQGSRKKLSPMQILELQFEVQKDHDSRLSKLENNMVIDYGQAVTVKKTVDQKIRAVMGEGYNNRKLRTKVYTSVWRDFKGFFNITSYHNTLKKDFDRAIEIIQSWNPSGSLLREITEENMQVRI